MCAVLATQEETGRLMTEPMSIAPTAAIGPEHTGRRRTRMVLMAKRKGAARMPSSKSWKADPPRRESPERRPHRHDDIDGPCQDPGGTSRGHALAREEAARQGQGD
jgi:hypothetical protein